MLDAAGGRTRVTGLDEAQRHSRRANPRAISATSGKFIFDVAHNPAGAEVLVQTLRAVSPPQPDHRVCSACSATRIGAR